MKFSQYGRRSLTDIKSRYKSYTKKMIDFLNETIVAFKLKQIDIVNIENSISDRTNKEELRKVGDAIGKLNLQRRTFLNMIHVNLFAYFEAFNKDFFLEVYLSKPESLLKTSKAIKKGEKDKALSYRKILEVSTYEEIIFHMAYKQIDNYGRLNIDDLNKELDNKFNTKLSKDFNAWKELRENYYRRNVIVHNKSQISEIYAFKMDCVEKIGQRLKNTPEYIINVKNNIDKYIDFIYENISMKFK